MEIALQEHRKTESAEGTYLNASETSAATSRPQGMPAEKRSRRMSGFTAASQSVEGRDEENRVSGTSPGDSLIMNSVKLEVEAFKAKRKVPMFNMEKKEQVFCDPLAWWKTECRNFLHLAKLARRVLAVPTT